MFRHRNHLHRWAACALALWMMGVLVGIANACVVTHVTGPAGHAHGFAVESVDPQHDGHGVDEGDAGGADHLELANMHHQAAVPHVGSADRSNCRDFCNKVAASIAPLKSALDDVQGHAPPPLADAIALPVPVRLPVQIWVPRRDGVLAPPIPIAFLRLAL